MGSEGAMSEVGGLWCLYTWKTKKRVIQVKTVSISGKHREAYKSFYQSCLKVKRTAFERQYIVSSNSGNSHVDWDVYFFPQLPTKLFYRWEDRSFMGFCYSPMVTKLVTATVKIRTWIYSMLEPILFSSFQTKLVLSSRKCSSRDWSLLGNLEGIPVLW